MEEPMKGRLLLVGEGDFSFAVALLSRCDFHGDRVVVSSLESEDTIQKHQLAAENKQILEEKGMKVCFEVDATELQTCGALQVTEETKFSRIVFNFPHAGGKSNHKKNRALLNNFFSSAVKVLAPEGQVMVTLCKGQGGTPADQPMRAWHDSWQVVSMAANANLILTNVLPFKTEEFPEYNSVGFRSQDKGFNTDGALIHVFEVADAVLVPDCLDSGTVNLAGKSYSCCGYLEQKLNRKLLYSLHHPLHQLRTSLEGLLSSELTSQAHHLDNTSLVKDGLAPRVISQLGDEQQAEAWMESFFPKPYFLSENSMQSSNISLKEEENMEEKEQDDTEMVIKDESEKVGEEELTTDGIIRSRLRTSVVEELPTLVSIMAASGVGCHVVSSDVYGQCLISPWTSPVRHEMILVCKDTNTDAMIWNVSRSLQKATNFYYEMAQLKENVMVSSEFGDLYITHKVQIIYDENDTGEVCGCVLKWKNPEDGSVVLLVVLDLNTITLHVNSIPSQVLLWSTDPRFKTQFTDKTFVVKYQTISLYPMKYYHDLSFWENQSEQFDQQKFHNIVRNVTGDVVTNIKLIDSYHDDATDRSSLCYRLTFQSHDQSLSYITSWKLQSMLRLEVAKEMKISLR